MKKIIFVFAMVVSLLAQASVVSPTEALEIAQQFATRNAPLRAPGMNGSAARFKLAHTAFDATGAVDYYVFNRADATGYVMVAGDDIAVPVLGYSDSDTFNPNNIPQNMQWWLGEMQREMEFLKQHPEQARKAPATGKSVRPLLTCNWNQSAPYNNNCPVYNGSRCVTGCVATAMAQIMYYHKWPKQGKGSHSYSCNLNNSGNYVNLSADFSKSIYDWDNMLDNYGSSSPAISNAAVAKLMSDVGISVDMGYGESSGAFSSDVVNALTSYFDYDKSINIFYRIAYGIEVWENKIRTELDNKRPVYYSGQAATGGHAFVCDGYDADGYFHFNWGWGGMSNGYFILSMLNPSEQGIGSFEGGYNNSQAIITRIMPNEGGEPIVEPLHGVCSIMTSDKSVNVGDAANITINNVSMLGTNDWNTLYWGICVTTADENTPTIVESPNDWVNASAILVGYYYNVTGVTYTPSSSLSPGKYNLRYMWKKDNEQVGLFGGAVPSEYIIDMEIKNGVAYFSKHYDPSVLTATTQLNSNTIYKGLQFNVKTTITNSGSEFYGDISLALEQNNAVKLKSDVIKIAVAQGKSFSFETNLVANVPIGDYNLVVLDVENHVLGSTPVKVVDAGGSFSLSRASDLIPQSTEMPANDVNAQVTIYNSGGIFAGNLKMYIVREEGGSYYISQTVNSNPVTILNGSSAVVNFHGEFAGVVGTTYYLTLQNPHQSSTSTWGNWIPFTVCEPRVEPEYKTGDVNGDNVVNVVDINAIVSLLLGSANDEHRKRADVNGDGTINVVDINAIVAILLNK